MSKKYRFPVPRYKAPDVEDLGVRDIEFSVAEEEEVIGDINGQVARSPEEWRVSKALDMLRRKYVYQYPVGPPGIRGSYKVDFLVEEAPNWVPLEVQSKRYHTGAFAKDEVLRTSKIERILGAPIHEVWEDDLTTVMDAFQAVRHSLFSPTVRKRHNV